MALCDSLACTQQGAEHVAQCCFGGTAGVPIPADAASANRAKRKRGASAEATQIGDSVPSRFRVELVEEWDEPDYVSVKCRDPDGYIVEAA